MESKNWLRARLKFEQFLDWMINHKNLYNDYYKGFHNEVWEVDDMGMPIYLQQ